MEKFIEGIQYFLIGSGIGLWMVIIYENFIHIIDKKL
jgi:hypothetical protein